MKRIISLLSIVMISLLFAFAKADKKDITVGTVLTLQVYSTAQIPVLPYDPVVGPLVTNGTRYVVLGNRVIIQGNNSYGIVDLKAVSATAPIQYVSWPAYYTKIAFGGGI